MPNHDAWPEVNWRTVDDAARTEPPAPAHAASSARAGRLPPHLADRVAALMAEDEGFATRLRSLTGMQREVLLLLVLGRLNKQIAFELDISEATVKSHVTAVLRRLHVKSRTEAAVRSAVHISRDFA